MNTLIKPALLLVVACVAVAGCSQVVVPEDLAGNLRGLQGELAQGRAEVVKTTDSLRNLRENKGNDVKPQYATFVASMSALENKVGGMQQAGAVSREKAGAFFNGWDAQIAKIQDENVAKSTAERRKQTMEEYTKVRGKIQQLKEAYAPYHASLNDVRTSMDIDTTRQGANAARSAMDKAIDGEKAVLERLDDVNKSISDIIGP